MKSHPDSSPREFDLDVTYDLSEVFDPMSPVTIAIQHYFGRQRSACHQVGYEPDDLGQITAGQLIRASGFRHLQLGEQVCFALITAKNTLISVLRRVTAAKRGGGKAQVSIDDCEPSQRDDHNILAAEERRGRLKKIFLTVLSDDATNILMARLVDELSNEEIASMFRRSKTAVATSISRSLQIVRSTASVTEQLHALLAA